MDTTQRSPFGWRQILLVAGAALLAHGGCLRSTFYLDDFTQVVEFDAVDHGLWYTAHLRAVTYLTYWLTWLLGGMSAPAFHAGNLLLHVAVSLTLLGFARDYLAGAAGLPEARAGRIALGAALLFAVHPLCSEMTNYVRARDIALVSEFALLAAWSVLRWRRGGRMRWLAVAGATFLAATFSKEVGCIVAGGTLALVWQATRSPGKRWRWPVRGGLAAALAGGGLLAMQFGPFRPLAGTLRESLTHPRLGWHLLTQARVFWRYAARVVLPVRLCSDHQIAWTYSAGDLVAWLSLAGMLAVVALAAALLWRARPLSPERAAAALGAVALFDILHRLGNVSGELMVEYRLYPVMTALCALLAWGWDRLAQECAARGGARWRRAAAYAGLGVVVLGILLSARRTLDWHRPETLAANVIAQYPLQARARQELQEADLRAHRWPAALDRQADIRRALDALAAFNAVPGPRRYDQDLATLTRMASEGNYACALAKAGQLREARAHLAWLRSAMESHRLTEPMFWAMFYYASGQVHAAAGERDEALMDLRDSQEMAQGLQFPERERRRVEAGER